MCGRRFRTFNGVDDFNREILLLKWILVYTAAPVHELWIGSLIGAVYHANCMDNGP